MSHALPPIAWDIGWLRERCLPEIPLCRGLVQSAPWINLVLLFIFFLLLPLNFVLQPGVIVELPRTPSEIGSPYGASVVVLSMPGDKREARREIVFFDDQPFGMDDERNLAALEKALERAAAHTPGMILTVLADRRVRHGTITQLYTLALKAGIRTIHIATSPETGSPSPL